MTNSKPKFVRAGAILELFPMDLSTLEKKAAAGDIHRKPDPANSQYFLYSIADAEREALPTEDRKSQFKEGNGQLWVWIRLATKRYKKSIPTLYRWQKEGKIHIEQRQFAGTRGVRDFVNDEEVRRVIRHREPMPVGYLTVENAAIQRKMHEGTIRRLVNAGELTGQRWRMDGSNGRTVSKMIISTASMDKYFKGREPERSAWASAIEAEKSYGFKAHTLYTWHRFGCPYIAGGKLSTKPFRIEKSNGRLCEVIHYLRAELEQVKPAFFRAAERRYLAPDGRTYLAWDEAAKIAGVKPVRLWAWSKSPCEHLPNSRSILSMPMPVRPKRATMKTMTVLGYDKDDVETIRRRIAGEEAPKSIPASSETLPPTSRNRKGIGGRPNASNEEAKIRYAILAAWNRASPDCSIKVFCLQARSMHNRQLSPELIEKYQRWAANRQARGR